MEARTNCTTPILQPVASLLLRSLWWLEVQSLRHVADIDRGHATYDCARDLADEASLNNLANLLRVSGKHREAEALHRRALEGKERELGRDHPSTLASVNNLAILLEDVGRHEEAERLHRAALEGRQQALGPGHPSTMASVRNLVKLLRATGRSQLAVGDHGPHQGGA
ncbi:unnamed protein product [Prorocentrum cordatum]|uniref:Kinesin light chain n=1 Tax=Prorocentrum cordatum TaxID=2364126 RepID=A0ABN9Y3L6_9DINO|nr:unnamed protein product [Polarella glacialis]